MRIKNLLSALAFLFIANIAFSQSFTIGGLVGWGVPQGDIFSMDGEKLSGGGLTFDLDALYHLDKFDNKLGLGINYNSSILFGKNSDAGLDIGIYGLTLYGVKAHYNFLDKKVTPYGSLALGLSQFAAPDVTDSNGNTIKGERSSGFGIKPEVGFILGGFVISTSYLVPMKYADFDRSAGVWQIAIGYRYISY